MLYVIHYWTDELASLRSNKELNVHSLHLKVLARKCHNYLSILVQIIYLRCVYTQHAKIHKLMRYACSIKSVLNDPRCYPTEASHYRQCSMKGLVCLQYKLCLGTKGFDPGQN